MTDPNELRQPLHDLLNATENQDRENAAILAQQLVAALDDSVPSPDPLGREARPATIRFSGLCHALLRDMRTAEKHIAGGNWDAALKVVKGAIHLLPDAYTFPSGRTVPR